MAPHGIRCLLRFIGRLGTLRLILAQPRRLPISAVPRAVTGTRRRASTCTRPSTFPAIAAREPCLVVNDLALREDGADDEFCELYFQAAVLHELAHVLQRPRL